MSTPQARIDANLCAIEDDLREIAASSDRDAFDQIVSLQVRAADMFDTAREQIVNECLRRNQARLERSILFFEEIARV